MSARGMLENPAMYAGYTTTPACCISDWIHIAMDIGTPFTSFHHHLIYMLEKSLSRYRKLYSCRFYKLIYPIKSKWLVRR